MKFWPKNFVGGRGGGLAKILPWAQERPKPPLHDPLSMSKKKHSGSFLLISEGKKKLNQRKKKFKSLPTVNFIASVITPLMPIDKVYPNNALIRSLKSLVTRKQIENTTKGTNTTRN